MHHMSPSNRSIPAMATSALLLLHLGLGAGSLDTVS